MRKLTMGVMALALASSAPVWAQDSVGAPPEQTHFKVSTYKPAVHDAATANAAVCGLALAVIAHFGGTCEHMSCEWLDLVGGLWLVVAPFVLGFGGEHVAAMNCIAVGACIAFLSAWALHLDREVGRLWHRVIAGH